MPWQSPTRPWLVVLPAAKLPAAVVPTIGADAFARARVGSVGTWPAPRPEDDGVSALVEAFGSVESVSGRVGAEMGPETTLRMPLLDFETLRGQIQARGRTVVDDGDVMKQTRLVKSSMEIAKAPKKQNS